MADIEHAKSCSGLNVFQNFGQTAQVVGLKVRAPK